MPVYVISDVAFRDVTALHTYQQDIATSVARYGGRSLTRSGETSGLETEGASRAIVMAEFADMTAAQIWYQSPEVAKALDMGDQVLRRNLFLVEGLAPPA